MNEKEVIISSEAKLALDIATHVMNSLGLEFQDFGTYVNPNIPEEYQWGYSIHALQYGVRWCLSLLEPGDHDIDNPVSQIEFDLAELSGFKKTVQALMDMNEFNVQERLQVLTSKD